MKTSASRVRQNVLQRINNLLKPLTRRVTALISALSRSGIPGSSSFLRSVGAEALVTLQIYPVAVVLILVFGTLSILIPVDSLQTGLLPVSFGGMALVLADLATREKTAGTLGILFASPRLKSNFVWWKFATALLIAFSFTGLAILKIGLVYSAGAVALICGSIFTAACATSLGLMSSNPKAFTVLFLMFLYLVMNDKGENAGLDFAGWYHVATPIILAKYLGIAAALLSSAHLFHRWQLRRNF